MFRPQAPKGASGLNRPLRVEPRPEALPEWVGAVHSVPLIPCTPPFVAEEEAVVGDQDGERDGHFCHTQTTTDYDYGDYYGNYDNPDYEPPVVEVPQPVRLIQPILIERQGDQWVQVPGYSQSSAPAPPAQPKIVETTQLRAATARPRRSRRTLSRASACGLGVSRRACGRGQQLHDHR